jgi:hypothetical protein
MIGVRECDDVDKSTEQPSYRRYGQRRTQRRAVVRIRFLRSARIGFWQRRGVQASIADPIKAGFSLADYYGLAGADNSFGFFSIAAVVTVPPGGTTGFGAWNLHGGVEYQALGDTT